MSKPQFETLRDAILAGYRLPNLSVGDMDIGHAPGHAYETMTGIPSVQVVLTKTGGHREGYPWLPMLPVQAGYSAERAEWTRQLNTIPG